jgi:hypothetical protein
MYNYEILGDAKAVGPVALGSLSEITGGVYSVAYVSLGALFEIT